jgi:class 3 adenylate cyclase
MLLTHQQVLDFEAENRRSSRVINTLFPPRVAAKLPGILEDVYLEHHEVSCILSTDIVGYTSLSGTVGAVTVIELLNKMFIQFDELCQRNSVEKIYSIGDGEFI